MSDYRSAGRTNYVKVTDLALLEASAKAFGYNVVPDAGYEKMYCILGSTENGWRNCVHDGNYGVDDEFSFEKHIMPYVEEGEVLIALEIGREEMIYVQGSANAFIRNGQRVERVNVFLSDIYKLAAKVFDKPVESINRI